MSAPLPLADGLVPCPRCPRAEAWPCGLCGDTGRVSAVEPVVTHSTFDPPTEPEAVSAPLPLGHPFEEHPQILDLCHARGDNGMRCCGPRVDHEPAPDHVVEVSNMVPEPCGRVAPVEPWVTHSVTPRTSVDVAREIAQPLNVGGLYAGEIIPVARLIESYVQQRIQAEREACAQIATAHLRNTAKLASNPPQSEAAWQIAAAIRARGGQQ